MSATGRLSSMKNSSPATPETDRPSASMQEICNLIDATSWGRDFTFEQIKSLARYMNLHHIEAGHTLFKEGSKGSYFLIIAEGRVDILKRDSTDTPRKVCTLKAGDTLGEMSLIDGEPRSATAIATTDVTLLVITAERFAMLSDKLPKIALAMVLKMAKQMSQHLRLTSGQLIDHLPPQAHNT